MKQTERETYARPCIFIVAVNTKDSAILTESSWNDGSVPDTINDIYDEEL